MLRTKRTQQFRDTVNKNYFLKIVEFVKDNKDQEGIDKIMKYYDIEKDIFNLDKFDSYLKSDVFLYSVCNTNIINFPFLNLTKFPSTIHKKHDAIIRDPVMNFINANKKEMMEIMDKIEL